MSVEDINLGNYESNYVADTTSNSKNNTDNQIANQSIYDNYLKEEGSENWYADKHSSSLIIDGQERGNTIYATIDKDNNFTIGKGFGSDYNAYCEYEYMEEWSQESFIYKIADDMDNDGNYNVTYYDSKGNVSISGVDTNLDGVIDKDILLNNNCDGVIDAFSQGSSGDCWLLSGINAMASTEEGAEIIKNAIEVQEDGSTVVHTYFGDYTITKEELQEAKLSYSGDGPTYSAGDDDVLVLELAVEKVLNDKKDGEIKFSGMTNILEGVQDLINSFTHDETSKSIDGNITGIFNYIMTGKETSYNFTKGAMNKALDNFEKGNVSSATLSSLINRNLNGPNGKVYIVGTHTYAIKSVEGDVVTLLNPWDSNKEIKVYRNDLTKYLNVIETL